jgi:hypothetical protein
MRDNTLCKTGQSWRFIHDPVAFRKKRALSMLFGAVLTVFPWMLFIGLRYSSEPQTLSGRGIWLLLVMAIVLVCLLYGGGYHLFKKGISFVIDGKGIRFSWHFFGAYNTAWRTRRFPRLFDWPAIEAIRLVPSSTLLATKSLAFRVKGAAQGLPDGQDAWYILPIATWAGETYIGDGHAHSLVNALTAAQGRRIEEIRTGEIDRLPLLLGQRVIRIGKDDAVPLTKRDLGKRFLWVTLAIPAVMAAGTMIAASVEESPVLLKVSEFMVSDMLIFGGGILLAIAAGLYLRKEGNEGVACLLCLLLGGVGSFFLFMPVTYSLPEWLGEATKERFSVIHADTVCQEWRGIGAPELSFSLYAEPGKRSYPEIGMQREFTVHRGPLRLVSIPGKEFDALYEKGAKISFGRCAPNAAKKTRKNQRGLA